MLLHWNEGWKSLVKILQWYIFPSSCFVDVNAKAEYRCSKIKIRLRENKLVSFCFNNHLNVYCYQKCRSWPYLMKVLSSVISKLFCSVLHWSNVLHLWFIRFILSIKDVFENYQMLISSYWRVYPFNFRFIADLNYLRTHCVFSSISYLNIYIIYAFLHIYSICQLKVKQLWQIYFNEQNKKDLTDRLIKKDIM